jgi:hypothetical protein
VAGTGGRAREEVEVEQRGNGGRWLCGRRGKRGVRPAHREMGVVEGMGKEDAAEVVWAAGRCVGRGLCGGRRNGGAEEAAAGARAREVNGCVEGIAVRGNGKGGVGCGVAEVVGSRARWRWEEEMGSGVDVGWWKGKETEVRAEGRGAACRGGGGGGTQVVDGRPATQEL